MALFKRRKVLWIFAGVVGVGMLALLTVARKGDDELAKLLSLSPEIRQVVRYRAGDATMVATDYEISVTPREAMRLFAGKRTYSPFHVPRAAFGSVELPSGDDVTVFQGDDATSSIVQVIRTDRSIWETMLVRFRRRFD